jgi:hypothetical protein
MTPLQRGRLIFSASAVVFFAATLYATTNFRLVVAGYFPGFAAGLGLIMTSAVLVTEIREVRRSRLADGEQGPAEEDPATVDERAEREASADSAEVDESVGAASAPEVTEELVVLLPSEEDGSTGPAKAYLRVLGWLGSGAGVIAIVGLPVGAALFLVAFLKFEAKEGWLYTVIATAGAMAFLYGTAELFRLQWPPSLLFG